ncbi:MAG TPA: hypothetical protein VJ742_04165 [Nitrososphaera sp.]|nr:hypothetical protein [Nitrososphaera sp.]
MTRMRMSHSYREVKALNPETFCTKCGEATAHVCEWCGACYDCHKGAKVEKSY